MAIFFRLSEYKSQQEKEKAFVSGSDNDKYIADNDDFIQLPGKPIAYWISSNVRKAFAGKLLYNYGETKQGFATGNNDLFLRMWFEVEENKLFNGSDERKWYFCNKGGSYRKWYGNNYYVANWENDGREMKKYKGSVIRNPKYYKKEGLTWSSLANDLSMRYSPETFIFESKGSMFFAYDNSMLKYLLALLNSKVVAVFLGVLSPTLDFHEGPMSKVPVIDDLYYREEVNLLSNENVLLSKDDWDFFEISADFKQHILKYDGGTKETLISDKYEQWINKSEDRFLKIKKNEERLNEIFIEIYGLEKEINPSVPDNAISLRKANLEREIKSLISYAVGCIMGRYSLKEEGLIYAGGKWDDLKYSDDFRPCEYGIMPITDEQFFEEDLCTRVIDFIKVVYGEDTLAENLKFIAKALNPNSYEAPRKIIRDYLFNDFFDNHYQIYQHRPIYWQLDSGKAGGFKAILYMHRYNENSLSIVRTEYIQELRYKYEDEMQRLQRRHADTKTTAERNAVKKEITALDRKIVECSVYDELLNHVTGNIHNYSFDLDDGVKTNYAKFLSIDGDKNKNILTVIKL